MGPGARGHRQWLEEALGAQRATLSSGTDGAVREKLLRVLADGWPPEVVAQEGKGAVDFSPDLIRHVEPPGWGIDGRSDALQGPLHMAFDVKVGGCSYVSAGQW